MKTYKQFLTEASTKNLHLEHLEDEVLNGGVNGTRGAINFLRSLRDMLAGSSKSSTTVTVKWDGAPAVAAGIDPQSGQFFVAYKSMKKLCFTQEDVRQNFDGPLQKIYSALMEHLPKLNIKSNVYQGDVLWYDDSQKKKQTIDGQKWLTFTPNTITYAVPVNSDIATTIDMAAVGIVFHTTYSTGGAETVDDLKASFGADTSSFTKHRDVWSINADFTDLSGHATFTERETTTITSMLSEAGKTFNQINGRFLDAIAQDDKIKVLIKTYLNSKIRDGEFIRNINKTAKEVVQFIKDRLEAVRAEEEQLTATLSSLNGAIQVSKHYLGMFKEVESEVNTTTEKPSPISSLKFLSVTCATIVDKKNNNPIKYLIILSYLSLLLAT